MNGTSINIEVMQLIPRRSGRWCRVCALSMTGNLQQLLILKTEMKYL